MLNINMRLTVKNKILACFFIKENKRAYINELARSINADAKNVYRALVQLEKENILSSEFKGKERYFYLNKNNPLYKEYKNIFLKTAGIEPLLKEKIKNIQGLTEAYIFGSYANKKITDKSDIDILLIGHHKRLEAEKKIYETQKYIGTDISVINITPEELEKKQKNDDQFIRDVFKKKVIKLL